MLHPLPFHTLQLQLRPHAYYELAHGCELVLADVRCQYLIGEQVPTGIDSEQTQAYDLGDEGGGGGGEEETECPAASSVEDSEGVALRRGRRRGGRLESDSSASGEGENEAEESREAGKKEGKNVWGELCRKKCLYCCTLLAQECSCNRTRTHIVHIPHVPLHACLHTLTSFTHKQSKVPCLQEA